MLKRDQYQKQHLYWREGREYKILKSLPFGFYRGMWRYVFGLTDLINDFAEQKISKKTKKPCPIQSAHNINKR